MTYIDELIHMVGWMHIQLSLPPIRGGQFKVSWLEEEYERCANMLDYEPIEINK